MDYYVHADILSHLVTDLLRTLSLIILKFPAVVWKQLHGCITDADQVGEPLDPFYGTDHVVAERPECLCLIIAGLYVPAQRKQAQGQHALGMVPADLLLCLFLRFSGGPFRIRRAQEQAEAAGIFRVRSCHKSRNGTVFPQTCNDFAASHGIRNAFGPSCMFFYCTKRKKL